MSEPLNVCIATLPKNQREEIRIGFGEFKGTQYLDLRVYAEFAGTTEARSPTKTGLTVSFANLPAFVEAVNEAQRQAVARGLTGEGK